MGADLMATSQNGYPVLGKAQTRACPVPGTTLALRVRPGPCGDALVHVAARFNVLVEPIVGPVYDDWGWAVRPIRGQTTGYSNHASGTAIDLNATTHPRGVHGTFSTAKVAAVRVILAELADPVTGRRVIRWGGDYTAPSTIDTMHFEINANEAAVRRALATLSKEDDMQPLSDADAAKVAAAVWTRFEIHTPDGGTIPLQQALGTLLAEQAALKAQVAALATGVR
jgi:hypothetical protein